MVIHIPCPCNNSPDFRETFKNSCFEPSIFTVHSARGVRGGPGESCRWVVHFTDTKHNHRVGVRFYCNLFKPVNTRLGKLSIVKNVNSRDCQIEYIILETVCKGHHSAVNNLNYVVKNPELFRWFLILQDWRRRKFEQSNIRSEVFGLCLCMCVYLWSIRASHNATIYSNYDSEWTRIS